MAGSTNALADVEKLTKRAYHDDNIIRTFNYDRVLHAMIDRQPIETDQGGGFHFPFHIGGTSNGGFIAETDDTPDSAVQRRDWAYFTRVPQYVKPLRLTTKAMHATGSKKAAVRQAAKSELDGLTKDARIDFAIRIYTPHTGLLATCTYAVDTTHFYVQFGAHRRLRVNQVVAVAKISDFAVTNGKASTTITDINPKTGLITVGTALSGTTWTRDTYGISDHGVYHILSFGYFNAPFGLEEIIAESNYAGAVGVLKYGNIDRSAAGTSWFYGNVIDAEWGDVDNAMGDELCDMVSVQGEGEIKIFVTTPEILREIKKQSVGTKRSTMRVMKASEWYTDVEFAGKPIVADRFCTPGCIYGLDLDKIQIGEEKSAGFEQMDGSVWHLMETKLAYQCVYTRHYELIAWPHAQGVIKNVRAHGYGIGGSESVN